MIIARKESEKRSDWAIWQHYMLSNGVVCVTTAAFNEVMDGWAKNLIWGNIAKPRDIVHLLNAYKRLARSDKQGRHREQISEWKFAQFFAIGDSKIGVREEVRKGESAIKDKMMRMDVIQHFLDVGWVPRWIQKPAQYGYMTIPNKDWNGGCVDYLLMDKIDHGVTVEDIKNGCRNEKIKHALFVELWKTFWFSSESDDAFEVFRTDILKMYDQMARSLKENFKQHRNELWTMCWRRWEIFCFEDLFTDLAEKNIVVDELNPPTWGKRVWFWIIDQ